MFSILAVSNQQELSSAIVASLPPSDYQCTIIPHGDTVADRLVQSSPDVLIFDHGDGSHVAEWRALGEEPPLLDHLGLLVVVRPDQARLLDEAPAPDDFTLPSAPAPEILMRVRAILRRKSHIDSENILRSGDLVVDLSNYKVTLDGQPVDLTYKEYELLRFLMSNRDKVFTREALLNHVWGYDYFGGARTVDVHIRRLRSKIESHGNSFVETIRNVGYRFRSG